MRIEDEIDPTVGFIGDAELFAMRVSLEGDCWAWCFAATEAKAREAAQQIQAAYEINQEFRDERPRLIKEVINE